jgi:hypothetical protein
VNLVAVFRQRLLSCMPPLTMLVLLLLLLVLLV